MRDLFTLPDEDIFRRQASDSFELFKAWAGTTLAFAILQTGASNLISSAFLSNLFMSGVVCGFAFVLHELAHRVVARHYGAEAHFVANNSWLLVSVLVAFAGFFIAAPGAVWHRGYLTARQGGLIALAGPVTNMILAVLFLVFTMVILLSPGLAPLWMLSLGLTGFKLNGWIGLFNMIPAGPFDGAKVLNWSPLVFGITVAVGVVLSFVITDQLLASFLMALRAVSMKG